MHDSPGTVSYPNSHGTLRVPVHRHLAEAPIEPQLDDQGTADIRRKEDLSKTLSTSDLCGSLFINLRFFGRASSTANECLPSVGHDRASSAWHARAAVLFLLLTMVCGLAGGCSNNGYLKVRKVPKNPLEGPLNLLSHKGPQPTERTLQTLRRYDLEKLQSKDPDTALMRLQEEISKEPIADKLRAFAELAYIAAYKADAVGNDARALNLYGATVFYAYDYLFDPLYDSLRNPYDPQFRRACDLYNSGLEAALRLMDRKGQLTPGETLMVDTGTEQIRVDVVARGPWKVQDFEEFEFASDFQITGLKNHNHSYGLGVPMIAVRRPGSADDPMEQYYPEKPTFPVTAFLRTVPIQPGQQGRAGRSCVLELFDPLDSSTTQVANRLVPLETDLSTPLGYQLEKGQGNQALAVATLGLLKPDSGASLQGLYMVEPYDPDKIPVLLVHGLWSSPMTWMEMFNDLRSVSGHPRELPVLVLSVSHR